jgi:hypothetical protein
MPATTMTPQTSSSSSSLSHHSVTYFVKVLTFMLIGFAGGLSYHLYFSSSNTDHRHQEWLQAGDSVVKQLMTENQQHQQELVSLRQEVTRANETTQRLRRHATLEEFVHEAKVHEHDPNAFLWSDEVHKARLKDAHQQAEALLQRTIGHVTR